MIFLFLFFCFNSRDGKESKILVFSYFGFRFEIYHSLKNYAVTSRDNVAVCIMSMSFSNFQLNRFYSKLNKGNSLAFGFTFCSVWVERQSYF